MEKLEHHLPRLAGKIVGTAVLLSLAVLLWGYFLNWDQPLLYSNGFFTASAIVLGWASIPWQVDIAERNQRAVRI